jgi:hypothetical protein
MKEKLIKCSEVNYYLQNYVEGLLPDEMRSLIKAHLSVCAGCSKNFEALKNEDEVPVDPDKSNDFWEKVNIKERWRKRNRIINKFFKKRNKEGARFGKVFENPKLLLLIIVTILILFIAAISFMFFLSEDTAAAWEVEAVSGTPVLASKVLSGGGMMKAGDWLITNDESSAKIIAGQLGEIYIEPNSRIRLLRTLPTEHRVRMIHGRLTAEISAPPGYFFIESPAAEIINYRSSCIVELDEEGNGIIIVKEGVTAVSNKLGKSFIKEGGICEIKKGAAPGIPFLEDAPLFLVALIRRVDNKIEMDNVFFISLLNSAREKDLFSLWHLFKKVDDDRKVMIYNKMISLNNSFIGITREGILSGNPEMIERWGEMIIFN